MRTSRIVSLLAVLSLAPAAWANRTYVSSAGDDANPCTLALPCRLLQAALALTSDKGEVIVLDSGGYAGGGTITITKSVTIDGTGVRASTTNGTGDSFVISDPGFNQIIVTLRNIAINGGGTGGNGISFQSGKRLNLEHVIIHGFTGKGINMTTGASAYLSMTDVRIQDVGDVGINVVPTTGAVVLNAKDVRVYESATQSAMYLNGNIRAIISDSEFSNCPGGAGIAIAGPANVGLDHVLATGNKWGVWNYTGTPVTRVMNSMFIGNTLNGALVSAGSITAYQSNVIENASGVTSSPPM